MELCPNMKKALPSIRRIQKHRKALVGDLGTFYSPRQAHLQAASCMAKACVILSQQVMQKRRGVSGPPTQVVFVYKQVQPKTRKLPPRFLLGKAIGAGILTLFDGKGDSNRTHCWLATGIACDVFSDVPSKFGCAEIETDRATRVYMHHNRDIIARCMFCCWPMASLLGCVRRGGLCCGTELYSQHSAVLYPTPGLRD